MATLTVLQSEPPHPVATQKVCRRCGHAPPKKGERFCGGCKQVVLREMRSSGYLASAKDQGRAIINESKGRSVVRSFEPEYLPDDDGPEEQYRPPPEVRVVKHSSAAGRECPSLDCIDLPPAPPLEPKERPSK